MSRSGTIWDNAAAQIGGALVDQSDFGSPQAVRAGWAGSKPISDAPIINQALKFAGCDVVVLSLRLENSESASVDGQHRSQAINASGVGSVSSNGTGRVG